MADDNRLGEKIVTLRTAHHLSSRDLADRCGCDVSIIEGLERGELPASLAPLIKITRALGVRLGTLMDDDENLGPAYIDRDQMEEVERTKSLETTSGGDLNYFSLCRAPSRHMDPFVITVDPSGEPITAGGARRRGVALRHGGLHRDRVRQGAVRAASRRASTAPSCLIRCVPMTARRRSSWPSYTPI
ncbi:MAG: helix-turn-helix domain-containing protein [Eggerthellaceae bacterium]